MTNTQDDSKTVADTLRELGFSMLRCEASHSNPFFDPDEGSHYQAHWSLTLELGGAIRSLPYSTGGADRVWVEVPKVCHKHYPNQKALEHQHLAHYLEQKKYRDALPKVGDAVHYKDLIEPKDLKTHCKETLPASLLACTKANEPTLEDVVYCMVMDAEGVEGELDFADWAEGLGWSDDSIKASRCYNACRETLRWFTDNLNERDWDLLKEAYQDF